MRDSVFGTRAAHLEILSLINNTVRSPHLTKVRSRAVLSRAELFREFGISSYHWKPDTEPVSVRPWVGGEECFIERLVTNSKKAISRLIYYVDL